MPVLGRELETGQDVVLTDDARRQGVYVIGTTGTGKTTLLQNIAYQDMTQQKKGTFIDKICHLLTNFVNEGARKQQLMN